jgi:hypothetical protein
MARSRDGAHAARVEKVRIRFERWRRTRRRGTRIPEALWRSAADLARLDGVNAIAQALGLDYYQLKRRTAEATAPDSKQCETSRPAFVELKTPPTAQSSDCTIELTGRDGASMRIRLQAVADLDLVGLAASFWSHRR